MPISRGITDYDKRLKILRQQHFGGKQSTNYQLQSTANKAEDPSQKTGSDLVYLKQDLLKISVLASLAVGVQFLIYFALKNNLVKIPI